MIKIANIKVLETNLKLVAEIDDYGSLVFQQNLWGTGKFVLKINFNKLHAKELTKNRLIMIDDDPEKVGIIKEFKYTQINNDQELEIIGVELKGILKQRITIPPAGFDTDSYSSIPFETIVKDIIYKNCINVPGRPNFNFTKLELDTDVGRGSSLTFNTRFKNLEEDIIKLGKIAEMGWEIYIDFSVSKWKFEVIEGVNRTTGSSNPVFFSDNYDNLISQVYVDTDLEKTNFVMVGGQGVGASRTIQDVGGSDSDVDLYVDFIDARDISSSADLIARGSQKIAERTILETFDAEVRANAPFELGVDYNLGDFVTIQNTKLGIELDRQITGITHFFEFGNNVVEITFGNTLGSIRKLIFEKTDSGVE